MINIRWLVLFSYKNDNGDFLQRKYSVYASSKFYAERVAKEYFSAEVGICSYSMKAVEETLTKTDIKRVIKARDIAFSTLCGEFNGLSYREFVLKAKNFDAFDINISENGIRSFKFSFMGLTVRVLFKDNISLIDTSEIFLSSSSSKILILNNWTEFYYVI